MLVTTALFVVIMYTKAFGSQKKGKFYLVCMKKIIREWKKAHWWASATGIVSIHIIFVISSSSCYHKINQHPLSKISPGEGKQRRIKQQYLLTDFLSLSRGLVMLFEYEMKNVKKAFKYLLFCGGYK